MSDVRRDPINKNNLILLGIFALLLLFFWIFFIRDYSNRIDVEDQSIIFTTKIEKIEELDCPQFQIITDDTKCIEITFVDTQTGEQETLLMNGVISLNSQLDVLEEGVLIRVSKSEIVLLPPTEFDQVEIEQKGNEVLQEDQIEQETSTQYLFVGLDRINGYFWIFSIFILIVIGVTGVRGLKSLLSLALSILFITQVIIPLTIQGYDPVLVASLIGFLMFITLIFVTNGINKISFSSIGGAGIALIFTIIFTYWFSDIAYLTGFGDEETGVLSSILGLDLDIRGIIMASFILGVLGVVDDATVSQSYTVAELIYNNPDRSKKVIFLSAMRVGSSHIGSLINTLLLAYVATAFALIILLSLREQNFTDTISSDFAAEEIIRTVVGSIGLVLSIPAATLIATYWLKPKDMSGHEGHSHSH